MILANKPLPSYPLPQRQETVVPTRKKKIKLTAKSVARYAVVLLVIVSLSFVLVLRQAQIVAGYNAAEGLQADIAELEAANAVLQMQVAQLSSSSHIETVAREQLGMQKPTDSQIVKVGVSSNGN